jgi:hypothetical protein
MITIAVPVSMMVFARTLLLKEKSGKDKEQPFVFEQIEVIQENEKRFEVPEQVAVAVTETSDRQPDDASPSLSKEIFDKKQPEIPRQLNIQIKNGKIINEPTPVIQKNVEFLREDRDNDNIWVVYQASSKVDAIAFLSKQVVDKPSFYIVVETPEGNFGRDKDGFYEE